MIAVVTNRESLGWAARPHLVSRDNGDLRRRASLTPDRGLLLRRVGELGELFDVQLRERACQRGLLYRFRTDQTIAGLRQSYIRG